jgi:hypothetical protein
LFSFIKKSLLSWTEIPLERSANSLVQGERGTMTKGPSGTLQDNPCWLLSSVQKGRKIMAPSLESISLHGRFLAKDSPVLFTAPLSL